MSLPALSPQAAPEFVDAPLRARLTEVLERGIDFERVSYEKA